ncbi:MAG: hypothetical protein JSS30_07195 [Verrucomicrobia bacterium]|nr:hypothetical protein [Verrucomicrobiota bacterium]
MTRLLVVSSLITSLAISGGCSNSRDQETVTRGSRKEATRNKEEPIKRGCSRCGHRRTAD